MLRSQASTQPKGPPLAHSKWHAIENPKSEWCKPQRHPKSARSLHLTDRPWCLHAFATSCHYPTVGSPGGIFMHFCDARDACDIEESPQQSLSVSSIITPLSRGGGKCSLHYSSAVAWDLDFLKKNLFLWEYIIWYNVHLRLLKLRVWRRCNHALWYSMMLPTKKNKIRIDGDSQSATFYIIGSNCNWSNQKKSCKWRWNPPNICTLGGFNY